MIHGVGGGGKQRNPSGPGGGGGGGGATIRQNSSGQNCHQKPTAALDAYNEQIDPLGKIRDTFATMDEYRGPTAIGRMDLSDKRGMFRMFIKCPIKVCVS